MRRYKEGTRSGAVSASHELPTTLTSEGHSHLAMAAPRMFEQIVERMPEAVLVADRSGVIVYWNAAAEAMFGYSAAEATGQSLDLIIPERFRARHWAGYRTVMASGVTRYGHELLAVPAMRKDNRRISLEFSIVLLRGDGGEVVGAAAVIRDVTARWEREQTARASGGQTASADT
jgi:PAS domain S-box-containing protein